MARNMLIFGDEGLPAEGMYSTREEKVEQVMRFRVINLPNKKAGRISHPGFYNVQFSMINVQ